VCVRRVAWHSWGDEIHTLLVGLRAPLLPLLLEKEAVEMFGGCCKVQHKVKYGRSSPGRTYNYSYVLAIESAAGDLFCHIKSFICGYEWARFEQSALSLCSRSTHPTPTPASSRLTACPLSFNVNIKSF
jgi:hypothetical protein